jgi:fructoselysine-6-P-deglycase FrlB-like protein
VRGVDFVMLAARGASDHAGVRAQYLWNAQPIGRGVSCAVALYAVRIVAEAARRAGRRHFAVGASPDVVRVIEEGRRQGALAGDHERREFRRAGRRFT